MVDKVALPSPATITRLRFYADVAWMTTMASKHQAIIEGNGLLFGNLDSSPQGGRNYLMSEYTCMLPGKLEAAFDATQTMWHLTSCEEDEEDPDFAWGMEHCLCIVRESLTHHIFPPVGLGSRHGQGPHKCHSRNTAGEKSRAL